MCVSVNLKCTTCIILFQNVRCLLKCTVLDLCIAVLVAAMSLLIYFFPILCISNEYPQNLKKMCVTVNTKFTIILFQNVRCWLKCTILGLCLAIVVAAMALLIYFIIDHGTKGMNEPRCEKPGVLLMRKLRRRSAVQRPHS